MRATASWGDIMSGNRYLTILWIYEKPLSYTLNDLSDEFYIVWILSQLKNWWKKKQYAYVILISKLDGILFLSFCIRF